MSFASKTFLTLSCTATFSIIAYVHYNQYYEREQLRLGVLRDIERQARRKEENLLILQQQIELTKQLQEAQQQNHQISVG